MPIATVTQPQTIATAAGVLNHISIPFSQGAFPKVNSKILIQITDTDNYQDTKWSRPLYASDHDSVMMMGQRIPYYWEQHATSALPGTDVIDALVVSAYSMPFTKGLSVISLPEGAVLTLDYTVYAPGPSDHKPKQPPQDNVRTAIHAIDRRLSERALKIAAKIPVEPEAFDPRIYAILDRMRAAELERFPAGLNRSAFPTR